MTVSGDTINTAAVSATVNPPKNRSSTFSITSSLAVTATSASRKPEDGELIVTPTLPLLNDLVQVLETRVSSHRLFVRRSQYASPTLQKQRARFLHRVTSGDDDVLAAEELLIDLLRRAFEPHVRQLEPGAATKKLVERTKIFLEAHASRSLRLMDIARGVGASPAYLTDVFRRVEGIPVHRYLVQLRLAKALVELPHSDDLTQLALNLGFSSHSHFATVFRQAFDCTPSAFRELTRAEQILRRDQARRDMGPTRRPRPWTQADL
jgi:AraC family transcriptional regulator